jgi:GNAT superfamily N-acetyltransferase
MVKEDSKLDNPVWYSLNEKHEAFSIMLHDHMFYAPEFCPFGACSPQKNSAKAIDAYATKTANFYIVGKKPKHSSDIVINKNIVCNQMILNESIKLDVIEDIVSLRTKKHMDDLSTLINLVQPGFFRKRTFDLGAYFGVYKNNTLVAAAGERMKMKKYTEVSGIVTHPNFVGNGYASQLIKHTTDTIFKENKTPYLHVSKANKRASSIYFNLGFITRREISFWSLNKLKK